MSTPTDNVERPDTVRFILDGEVIELTDVDPTRTVLQFLREDLRRTGTKEGCAEGDCGACTVVVVEPDQTGEGVRARAINSCIQFLATLDGKELLTAESLVDKDGGLHPVQQAMVSCHGSQCGFCTPGFVMSMFALYKSNAHPRRRDIDDALAGNLCRCTGYRPIVDAATHMYDPTLRESKQPSWLLESSSDAPTDADRDKAAALQSIRRKNALSISSSGRRFRAPATVAELAEMAAASPDATLLAGGTDVGLWVTKQFRQLDDIIYTGNVAELNEIRTSATHVDIGAAVTLTDAMPVLIDAFPGIEEMLKRFASPPIRNAGTLGGNIANGSPIGDSMPALLVLDCELVLRHAASTRNVALNDFYLAYQETQLSAGEFVERILIPRPDPADHFAIYKISKRFDQDISAVCGAFRVAVDGDSVSDARIAYGGMAAVPKRASNAEQALVDSGWTEAGVQAAMQALSTDFAPISDMRATADYRSEVAANLLYKFWLEYEGGLEGVYAYGR